MKRFLESQPEYPKDTVSGEVRNSRITEILTRPLYAGYVEAPAWHVSRRKGHHQGLISYETFERIHRSNLVGMGVIPFEFTGGDTRKSLGLKGDEVVSIDGLEGDLKPLSLVPCTIQYADGSKKTIQIKCRIDTAIEIEYVENGGVLHYVLRDLASSRYSKRIVSRCKGPARPGLQHFSRVRRQDF